MTDRNWLEAALNRGLSKVEAPDELWARVRSPSAGRRRSSGNPLVWTFAAGLGLVVAAILGLRAHESHAAGPMVGDPAQITAWVKSRTGLDLALPDTLPPSVRVLGVRVVDAEAPSVEVSYQAGNRVATLIVARAAGTGFTRHADLKIVNNGGKITWVAHGQAYTLASSGPEDLRAACLLCHAS